LTKSIVICRLDTVDKTTIGFYITIMSSLITVTGFVIAIVQINKTKKLSNAAYLASQDAKLAITNTIIVSSLSSKVKSIQEIQGDLLNRKNDIAYLHTKDLIHALIETRQLIISKEYSDQKIITETIVQLSILKRQIESAIFKNEKIDISKTNPKLSELELKLSELSAQNKFPLIGGSK